MMTSVRSFVFSVLASCFLLAPTSGSSEEYKLLVMGDSLGQGLGFGMARCLSRSNSFYVVNKGKTSSKLTNVRPVNWPDEAETLSLGGFDAVVVQIGANDIMGIRSSGARVSFGSPQWHTEYKSRVIEITQSFQKRSIPIIWVGVPYPRKAAWRKPYSLINDAIKAGAASVGVPFVSIWDDFLKDGQYSTYGEGVDGRQTLLRADDGVHFSMAGYIKVASLVLPHLGKSLKIKSLECEK